MVIEWCKPFCLQVNRFVALKICALGRYQHSRNKSCVIIPPPIMCSVVNCYK